MAKNQSFAAKVAKSSSGGAKHCPKCGEVVNNLMHVEAVKNEMETGYRFKQRMVPICKCENTDLLQ